ncbi:thioesterase family protein [Ruegeria lacuscaerulensis]|uniref:thioesterase family protein n=1 Tax=Ruegeria lacuscaerulensis TaxID=55218 RepID=UPI00147FA0C1|nr:thioesterase family protein [Ruegeria lacuscaerulensis]
MNEPLSGHDGPYDAPVEIRGFTVLPEWIDYNGHMNVGFYGVVFDMALERLMADHLGLGEVQVDALGQGPYILQSHMSFLREVQQDQPLYFRFRMLDADQKRGHYFAQMLSEEDDAVCATQEALFMNVSHTTGRSVSYPDWAAMRLAQMVRDHAGLETAPQVGQSIGIRRK